jgi:hypothetical protein
MSRSKSYYDLRDALALPGCPICRLRAEFTEQYLERLIYENVNDPGLRRKIRQARGFCKEHALGLARRGAALGVSIIARDVLREVLKTMEERHWPSFPSTPLARVQEALDPEGNRSPTIQLVSKLTAQTTCPVCVRTKEMEEIYYHALLDNLLGEEGLLTLYSASDGLCLPHFRQVLKHVRREPTFKALVSAQRAIWSKLEGQLSEAIRKSDYRFSNEPLGEEGKAWLRALAVIAGERLERGEK